MAEYTSNPTDIAIIGMAGRFPGAADLGELWANLRDGVESIVDLSDEALAAAGVSPDLLRDPNYVRRAPLLEGIELFDAGFWGLTPREAAILDPQQRVFLECAWESCEMAGYAPQHIPGRVGLFAGIGLNTYLLHNLLSNPALTESVGDYALMLANDKDYLATRTAFKLNLTGPAITVQTACSTSLVAVHLAVQSLLSGESDLALAGGVAIRVPQDQGYLYSEGMIHAPDGRCRPFDAAANGTVGGSGAGVVLLKRAEDAYRDGDQILAIIKGSAINNDGARKVGFTAPGINGQAQVIAEAQAVAGVAAESISYIEAHGTATRLGDPIEVAALTKAFRLSSSAHGFCALGSIKSNLGHLDNAAGVAGLIKTVLALRARVIPPTLHFATPNPALNLAETPFYIPGQAREWQPIDGVRRAGVSSFGIGGTNAHVVLEEAPPPAAPAAAWPWQLLPLSARSADALADSSTRLERHLADHPEQPLADVAYTLQVGRQPFDVRQIGVFDSHGAASDALALGQVLRGHVPAESPQVAFLCTGQGSQYPGMGRELYAAAPVFRSWVDHGATLAQPQLGRDIREILFDADSPLAAAALKDTQLAQPALFIVEYALAQQWIAWGVEPAALIGHSVGEYVAACLAGVFSLEDALAIVICRGRLMGQLPSGAMLSVAAAPDQLQELLPPGVELAAVNGPELCVLSGAADALQACQAMLEDRGLACRPLHTSHAFHSAHMDPMLASFADRLRQIVLSPPQIPLISNLTGDWLQADQATDPEYWARHVRATVQFAAGIDTLLENGSWACVELGPGKTLGSFVRANPAGRSGLVLQSLAHPQEQHSGLGLILTSLGRLWLHGHTINWAALHAERRQRVALPTYPFERSRHWVEAGAALAPTFRPDQRLPESRWLTTMAWVSAPLDAPLDRQPRCFIYAAGLLHQRLVAALQHHSDSVTVICPDDLAAAASDWLRQWRDCPADDTPQLIYLLDPAAPDSWEAGAADLLRAARRLGQIQRAGLITLVGQNSVALSPGESASPAQSEVRGLATVLAQENAALATRWIDVDPGYAAWLDGLVAELSQPAAPLVALRGRQRFKPRYTALELTSQPANPLRTGGTYCITGGTGVIGLALAEALARDVGARVALLSRSADGGSADRAICERIAAAGGEAMVLRADVTAAGQVRAALDAVEAAWGPINGVIHAAGIAGAAARIPATEIDAAQWAALTEAKLAGSVVLHEALRERRPDWVVAMSSLASILGGLGFGAYAAANAGLDALVQRFNRFGPTPWHSINWDGWAEPGASADPLSLTAAEGYAVLQQVLGQPGLSQVFVALSDLDQRLRRWVEPAATPAPTIAQKRPQLDSGYVAPRNPAESTLAAIWGELLGIDEVGVGDDFFELGGHSLLAAQMAARIRAAFELEVPLRTFFEYPTIAGFAAWIGEASLAQQLQEQAVGAVEREEIEL